MEIFKKLKHFYFFKWYERFSAVVGFWLHILVASGIYFFTENGFLTIFLISGVIYSTSLFSAEEKYNYGNI